MKDPAGRHESRRAVNARKRISRRPSRLGIPAGSTDKPDRVAEPDAGFPGLLRRVWRRAAEAGDLRSSLDVLLTLDGHVPGDIQLRALNSAEQAALTALCGLSWRDPDGATDSAADAAGTPAAATTEPAPDTSEAPAFLGEIGLATNGRIALRTPGARPLDPRDLVGGVRRVPYSRAALAAYRRELDRARERNAASAADCRAWLAEQGPEGRDALLAQAREATLRTAPFVLYQEDTQYTNFRGQNTLTGKTLWPGHPDCALSALQGLPLDLWSDQDTQLIVCLTLLIRSAGFGRVEEANGTQLTVDHVAYTLERVRRAYNAVPGVEPVPAAASHRVADLDRLAARLRERRQGLSRHAQLYREIHGALMHKVERVAAAPGPAARARQDAVTERLRARLPLAGGTLTELGRNLAAAPGWLAEPHGAFGTGLESLVYETVAATAEAFAADFAMSRGMRSLPGLVRALRGESWAEICDWDITHFFCCVVPRPEAAAHFGGSAAALADAAWAMSSRMQYNSWHFVAGNLPRVPEVVARDHFVPPVIPDVAFFSDQHHHGHVNNNVRFSIRSPQAVEVDGRRFDGFMDLRLLRCAGDPFDEQDLLAAQQVSAFIARATSLAAGLVAAGAELEVTAFDSGWHWTAVTGAGPAASGALAGQVRRAS
ncbi:hypothetical protein [Streptomyces jeddahensis]|uniref:Uncharacterized protein n=1 Tax=Streptomyces jeddahensis TaxID=1716141 RepID=A0A177HJS4_9ACTN|nr:hypothetical protein [Streptomyces jeddahensis]OAH10909.1 hypothetical protein STSP_57510 [Streptomyces jeddahensis]